MKSFIYLFVSDCDNRSFWLNWIIIDSIFSTKQENKNEPLLVYSLPGAYSAENLDEKVIQISQYFGYWILKSLGRGFPLFA
jgi:hypothetical protein